MMDMFGTVWILHHEIHVITLILSLIVFLLFFVKIKENILLKVITAGLGTFAALLLYEIPWNLAYSLYQGFPPPDGSMPAIFDVVMFSAGELLILHVFNTLRKAGLRIPEVNKKRMFVIFCLTCLFITFYAISGFYIQWIEYNRGNMTNPHLIFPFNLMWLFGKSVALMGWFWILEKKKTWVDVLVLCGKRKGSDIV